MTLKFLIFFYNIVGHETMNRGVGYTRYLRDHGLCITSLTFI